MLRVYKQMFNLKVSQKAIYRTKNDLFRKIKKEMFRKYRFVKNHLESLDL
jgi:hypothetical protein